MIHLAHPMLLMVGLLFLMPYLVRRRRAWHYSSLLLFSTRHQTGFRVLLTLGMMIGALTLLLIALARPQRSLAHTHREALARDIILVLDLSLSMEGHIQMHHEGHRTQRKLDVMQQTALAFVKRHQHDRLGLIVFGDDAFGAWPLSMDSTTLQKRLERLDDLLPADLRGTHVEKALLQSLDHMQELAQSQSKIIVMLTDGLDAISPQVQARLVRRLHKQGIKLYVLGVQLPENSSIMHLTHQAQGRYYAIDRADAMEKAFREIDYQEPSRIQIQREMRYQELYPFFVLPGLMLWLLSTVCRSFLVFDV
jgi:Ca-activated chloride channel family protein